MRSLIVSCNVTVDGFMSGPEGDAGSLDFIVPDLQQENDLAARLTSQVDTIVFGRQTFLAMEAYWTKVDSPMADWINATPKVVLSTDTNLDVDVWPKSSLAAGDAAEQVRRLKDSTGRDLVIFGGVRAIRSMITAGLVDEFWLKISPVAIGQGQSMFAHLTERRGFSLRTAKTFPSGMIDATYTAKSDLGVVD